MDFPIENCDFPWLCLFTMLYLEDRSRNFGDFRETSSLFPTFDMMISPSHLCVRFWECQDQEIFSLQVHICWTCDWNLLNTPWELGTCCICPLHLTPRWGQSHLNAMCMVGLHGVPHSVVVHGVPAMPEAAEEKHVLNGIDLMISRCIQKDSKKSYHILQ